MTSHEGPRDDRGNGHNQTPGPAGPYPGQYAAPYGAPHPYAAPPSAPYGQPAYQAPSAYPSPYGQPPYGYPSVQPRRTNGFAIASMVLGILWLYWIGSILALVFGYIARNQLRERNEAGGGMAVAGIVLGWVGVGFFALTLVFAVAGSAQLVIAEQTRAEVIGGFLSASLGQARMQGTSGQLENTTTFPVDHSLARACGELFATCKSIGHALHAKDHTGDRWIAATTILLDAPLLSNDGIYRGAPGLRLLEDEVDAS